MIGADSVEGIQLWLYRTQYAKGSAADRAQQVAVEEGLQAMIQAGAVPVIDERL